MPPVPPPDSLPSVAKLREQWIAEAGESVPERIREALRRPAPIDFRPVVPWNPLKPTRAEPRQAMWFRAVERMPDDPLLHTCMLTYASDYNLMPTALRPHGLSWIGGATIVASIDHAMWFHRPARVDEWLLYTMESPSAQGARGFARGLIYDRAGRLVASVAQEGLMRPATRQ
jgi:acyl-CoA thioesterase-2